MRNYIRTTALVTLLSINIVPVSAFDPGNALLPSPQQKELDSLCVTILIPSCDSCSISKACQRKKPCVVALHLAKFAKWIVSKGITYDDARKDLVRRLECLTQSNSTTITIKDLPVAGDSNAPVIIVTYVFDLCPLCTYLFSELHWEVTLGTLKGKARLVAKLFNENTNAAARARFSRFWNYIAALGTPLSRNDQRFPVTVADSADRYPPAFKQMAYDLKMKTQPVAFREQGSKEASVNPPIFINNKRYRSYNNPQWIVDAALYEFEMLRKHSGGKTDRLSSNN